MTKRLYALSDEGAARLREGIVQLVARQVITPGEVARSRVELTSLDPDAAVERMARALLARRYGGRTDGLSRVTRSRVRDDARAALNALLQED